MKKDIQYIEKELKDVEEKLLKLHDTIFREIVPVLTSAIQQVDILLRDDYKNEIPRRVEKRRQERKNGRYKEENHG